MTKMLTSKEYDAMAQRLERMTDGIGRHKGENGFPIRLDGDKRQAMRKALEDLREKWEALVKEADRAYKEHLGHYKYCKAELAQDDDAVRGFYSKTNPMVLEFGTRTITKPKGRRKRTAQ